MSNIDTGGAAFPAGIAATTNANHDPVVYDSDDRSAPGMSLRDYFAAAALQGILAKEGCTSDGITQALAGHDTNRDAHFFASNDAARAFVYADAMIAEKRRTERGGA